jgi:hypothetical protein
VVVELLKQVPDERSQQFELPVATAGQLFWQSRLAVHVAAQPPPLLPPLPLELPPDDDPPPPSSPGSVPSCPPPPES